MPSPCSLSLLAACLVLAACGGDPDRLAGPGTGGSGAGVPPTDVERTSPGESLEAPYDRDLDDAQRGAAFEYAQP